VGVTVSGGFRA